MRLIYGRRGNNAERWILLNYLNNNVQKFLGLLLHLMHSMLNTSSGRASGPQMTSCYISYTDRLTFVSWGKENFALGTRLFSFSPSSYYVLSLCRSASTCLKDNNISVHWFHNNSLSSKVWPSFSCRITVLIWGAAGIELARLTGWCVWGWGVGGYTAFCVTTHCQTWLTYPIEGWKRDRQRKMEGNRGSVWVNIRRERTR